MSFDTYRGYNYDRRSLRALAAFFLEQSEGKVVCPFHGSYYLHNAATDFRAFSVASAR